MSSDRLSEWLPPNPGVTRFPSPVFRDCDAPGSLWRTNLSDWATNSCPCSRFTSWSDVVSVLQVHGHMFCSVLWAASFSAALGHKPPNTNKHIHILIFFDSATQFLKVRDSSLGASFGSFNTPRSYQSALWGLNCASRLSSLQYLWGLVEEPWWRKKSATKFFVHWSQELVYIMKCWRFKHERWFSTLTASPGFRKDIDIIDIMKSSNLQIKNIRFFFDIVVSVSLASSPFHKGGFFRPLTTQDTFSWRFWSSHVAFPTFKTYCWNIGGAWGSFIPEQGTVLISNFRFTKFLFFKNF